jgi:hypothetical protein
MDATFSGMLLFEQVEGDMAKDSEVLGVADQIQVFRIGGAPTFAPVNSTVSFVGGFGMLKSSVVEILRLFHCEQHRNIFIQVTLVLFDAQNIVGSRFDDGGGGLGLGVSMASTVTIQPARARI